MAEKKKTRTRRLAGYFGRRIGNPFIQRAGREGLTTSYEGARSSLSVEKISPDEVRNAYRGRYKDGGRERFRESFSGSGLSEEDLTVLASNRRAQAFIMVVAAAFALFAGAAMPFFTTIFVISLSGLVFGIFSLLFLAIAFRHDYAAWQIESRRFGGVKEYIDIRWGSGKDARGPRVPVRSPGHDVKKS